MGHSARFSLSLPAPWAAVPFSSATSTAPGSTWPPAFSRTPKRRTEEINEIFQHVEKIESIGLLHAHHSAGNQRRNHGGRTWLTFTYDPGLLSTEDINRLVEMYQEQLAQPVENSHERLINDCLRRMIALGIAWLGLC